VTLLRTGQHASNSSRRISGQFFFNGLEATQMLKWNAAKVKNLTGVEIWLFIIARVFVGFGLGVLATQYFPQVANVLEYQRLSSA